jgi:hypothetical protein
MSDPKNTDKYLDLNRQALQRSVDECGTEADKAFHEANLDRHIKLEEVEENEPRKNTLPESV